MMKNISFTRFTEFGTFLILTLPLLVYTGLGNPYIFPKAILFIIIVDLIALAFLLFKKKIHTTLSLRHPIIFSSFLYLIVLGVTSITGIDPLLSFFSSTARMTGVFVILHAVIWFYLISSVSTHIHWQYLMRWSVGVATFVGFYALAQVIHVSGVLKTGGRIASTLGNPIFLAHYMLLHIWIALIAASRERNRVYRFLFILFVVFSSAIIFFTATRSSFYILLGGLIMYLFISIKQKKNIFFAALFLILTFFSMIFLLRQAVQGAPFQYAVRLISHPFSDSQRAEIWNVSIKAFLDKPFIGWGPGNNYPAFLTHVGLDSMNSSMMGGKVDNTHNIVLNTLVESGLLGFGTFMFFWASIAVCLIRYARVRASDAYLAPILSLFFSSSFLQNLTIFETPATLIIFFFMLSFLYHATRDYSWFGNSVFQSKRIRSLLSGMRPIVIAFVLYMLFLAGSTVLSQRYAFSAWEAFPHSLREGLLYYERALRMPGFFRAEIRGLLASSVIDEFPRSPSDSVLVRELIPRATQELRKNMEKHPYSLEWYLQYSALLRMQHITDPASGAITEATRVLKQARGLYPNNPDLPFELLQVAFVYDGKINDQALSELVNIAPRNPRTLWFIALSHVLKNETGKALNVLESSERLGYNIFETNGIWKELAKRAQSEDRERIKAHIEQGLTKYPSDPYLLSALSILSP